MISPCELTTVAESSTFSPVTTNLGEADLRFAIRGCSLGCALVAASPRGICAILLGDEPSVLITSLLAKFPGAAAVAAGAADPGFEQLLTCALALLNDEPSERDVPLDLRGTPFQRRVWDLLRDIPPGTTLSYTELAVRLGSPRSVRAVAQACARNNVAVLIPCHRVLRHDGSLSGYRWGSHRKQALLGREAAYAQTRDGATSRDRFIETRALAAPATV